MKWSVRAKGVTGYSGLLMISAFMMAVAAPPPVQADTPQTEVYPPGSLVFRGPNASSTASAATKTNASGAVSVLPPKLRLPPDLAEVVRLASSGMEEQAILAFIQNSQPFSPITPDQIVYLKDLGVTPRVLTAMLQHQRPEPGKTSPAMAMVPQNAELGAGPNYPFADTTDEETPPALPEGYDAAGALPGPGYYNPVDYGYVYNALAPYGSWVFLPGFGWSWQPTVGTICHGWRPYCDNGNWRWSECGWYWDSHYTWGQVPFHYGRWSQNPQYGWVWHPDRVWAPAWVSWRSSADVCGWAPLPPGANYNLANGWTYRGRATDPRGGFGLSATAYNFVDAQNFQHPAGHALPAQQARDAFKQTRPADQNGFVFGANQRIVNLGIDPFLVETTAHQAARPVAVTFPGGASFTDTPNSGQLPFNLHRRVEKSTSAPGANTSAQGGSALSPQQPLSATGIGGGGPGSRVVQRQGHVPQYSGTRSVAEAMNSTPQIQSQAPAEAATQTPAPAKQTLVPTGPPPGTKAALSTGKSAGAWAPVPPAPGHR